MRGKARQTMRVRVLATPSSDQLYETIMESTRQMPALLLASLCETHPLPNGTSETLQGADKRLSETQDCMLEPCLTSCVTHTLHIKRMVSGPPFARAAGCQRGPQYWITIFSVLTQGILAITRRRSIWKPQWMC